MARRVKPNEAAVQAQILLRQAVALLDIALLPRIAVHVEFARELLDQNLESIAQRDAANLPSGNLPLT